MTRVEFSIFPLLLFYLHFSCIKSVPSDYCLSPLNLSDCGQQPTPVFSYWKAASRCEIEMWRGCSSNNMFDNEYSCVDHCIGYIPNLARGGSSDGRFSITIDRLNIYELDEIYRILNAMEREKNTVRATTKKRYREDRLKNKSPKPAHLSKNTTDSSSESYEDYTEYLTPKYVSADPKDVENSRVVVLVRGRPHY